jgi:hypothetical protein
MANEFSAGAAIVGLGISEVGRVYGKTVSDFAAEAVLNAIADAGLQLADVDGAIMSNGQSRLQGPQTQSQRRDRGRDRGRGGPVRLDGGPVRAGVNRCLRPL